MIAGIDYSSRFVDVVLLDETTDAATWRRFSLAGADAFDRSRSVRKAMPSPVGEFWDEVVAIGIEDPRGYGAGSLYRIQGAVLARLPQTVLVHPWIPSAWRKAVGLSGNASKGEVQAYASLRLVGTGWTQWRQPATQDFFDAYCIALATRQAIQQVAA